MVELIVSGVAALIAVLFNSAVEMLAPLLSFDFELFNKTFPFAATAYSIFQSIALGIILLIATAQILPFFMQSQKSKTSPIRIGLSVIIAVFAVYYGNYFLSGIIDIAQMPYMAVTNANAFLFTGIDFNIVSSVISDVFYSASILLYIIVLIMIGIAFLKLLLEAIERYVILFVLVYLSPLAFSTLASDQTSGICKRFFSMFLSQCILMILNIWSLKMVVSVFFSLATNPEKLLALLMCYSFLRIAARLDSYLNQIGLNAAITGAGLGGELMATGMSLMSSLGGGLSGKKSGGGAESGPGGVLGLGQKIASGVGKVNPVSGAAQAGKNALGSLGKTFSQGVSSGKEAAAGTSGSIMDKVKAGFSAGKNTAADSIGGNMHRGWMRTQDESLLARGLGQHTNPTAAESADALTSGASLSATQREDIADNAFVAANAFNAFDPDSGAALDPSDVSAVMQGTGIERFAPDASEAINAGYGNIPAEDMAYKLDSTGLDAQYTHDGKTDAWSIKNASQYSALTPQEQSGYTPYRDRHGNQYYYKHTSSRAPSEAQKQQNALSERIGAFGANPTANPLSGKDLSELKKNQGGVNQVFSGLGASGVSISGKTGHGKQIAGVADAMRIPNMPSSAKAQMTTMLNSGSGAISAEMNGKGMSASWSDESGTHNLSVYSPSGAESHGKAALQDQGYRSFDVGGETYYSKYDAPATKDARFAGEVQQFVSNPSQNSISPEAFAAMRKKPEFTQQVFNGFSQNGTSMEYSSQNRMQFAGIVESTQFDGMRPSDKQSLVMHMRSDEMIGAKVNGNGLQAEWESDGYYNRMTVLTQSGMEHNEMDESNLAAKGYIHTNSNGMDLWTLHERMPSEKAADRVARDFSRETI